VAWVLLPLVFRNSIMTLSRVNPKPVNSLMSFSLKLSDGRIFCLESFVIVAVVIVEVDVEPLAPDVDGPDVKIIINWGG
jgi:hypothetical protein